MSVIKKELSYAKEFGDIGDAVAVLLKAIVEKKSAAEIFALELPAIISAVDGISGLGEEFQDKEAMCVAFGSLCGKVWGALVPPQAPVPPAPASAAV